MFGRLQGLIGKEFAQMLRDPVVLFLVFWLTTVEVVMCTMAIGYDVRDLGLGLVDHDRSAASRGLVEEMTAGDSFILRRQFATAREAADELRKGTLHVVVEIPPGFGARVDGGRPAEFGVIVDGSNATVGARARAYIIEMAARFTRGRAMGSMPMSGGVEPSVRVWYNPDLTNTRFSALNMLAQAGFMLAVILPAAGLVREKQNGTLEQVRVTPIRAHELFLGKIIPPILVTLGSVFPSLLVIRLLGVPMAGDLATLFLLEFLFLLSAVSIGVFVATLTSTLQQAMLASFFSLFPLLFLSGSIAPVDSMPRWLQVAAQASPLLHALESVTGVFLKGAGMRELWPHAAALVGISLPLLGGGWLIFRRQW